MNSLYPDDNLPYGRGIPPATPNVRHAKAEIEYLVEVFRMETESLKKTGQPVGRNVPIDFQPDLPSTS